MLFLRLSDEVAHEASTTNFSFSFLVRSESVRTKIQHGV